MGFNKEHLVETLLFLQSLVPTGVLNTDYWGLSEAGSMEPKAPSIPPWLPAAETMGVTWVIPPASGSSSSSAAPQELPPLPPLEVLRTDEGEPSPKRRAQGPSPTSASLDPPDDIPQFVLEPALPPALVLPDTPVAPPVDDDSVSSADTEERVVMRGRRLLTESETGSQSGEAGEEESHSQSGVDDVALLLDRALLSEGVQPPPGPPALAAAPPDTSLFHDDLTAPPEPPAPAVAPPVA